MNVKIADSEQAVKRDLPPLPVLAFSADLTPRAAKFAAVAALKLKPRASAARPKSRPAPAIR